MQGSQTSKLEYMYSHGYISTFQGVHYNQNSNCSGDALTRNRRDFFYFVGLQSNSGTKSLPNCAVDPFFGLQAKFWVYRVSFLLQKNMRKVWGYTSELINGQGVPMERKFGKPWASVSLVSEFIHSLSRQPARTFKLHTRAISVLAIVLSSQNRLLCSKSDNNVTRKRILVRYHTGTALSSGVPKLGYIYPLEVHFGFSRDTLN